jgi:hypothetical protein
MIVKDKFSGLLFLLIAILFISVIWALLFYDGGERFGVINISVPLERIDNLIVI